MYYYKRLQQKGRKTEMTVWCYKCKKHVVTNQEVKDNVNQELETIEYKCSVCRTVLQHRYREKNFQAEIRKI